MPPLVRSFLRWLVLLSLLPPQLTRAQSRGRCPNNLTLSTFAGMAPNGSPGSVDGPGVQARFNWPQGLALGAQSRQHRFGAAACARA